MTRRVLWALASLPGKRGEVPDPVELSGWGSEAAMGAASHVLARWHELSGGASLCWSDLWLFCKFAQES